MESVEQSHRPSLHTTTNNIGHNFLEHCTQDPWTLFLRTIFSFFRRLAPKMRRQTKQGRVLRPFVRRAGWIITAQICTNSFTPSNLMYALALSGHADLYQGSVHSAKEVSFLNACTVIFVRDLGIHPQRVLSSRRQ